MTQGDKALNASSVQHFRSVKSFIATDFTQRLTLHCYYFLKEDHRLMLHRRYFFTEVHCLTLRRRYFLK
jgi:hypothetical protein